MITNFIIIKLYICRKYEHESEHDAPFVNDLDLLIEEQKAIFDFSAIPRFTRQYLQQIRQVNPDKGPGANTRQQVNKKAKKS